MPILRGNAEISSSLRVTMMRSQHPTHIHTDKHTHTHTYIYIYTYIQGVPGGKYLTSGEFSLGQTIQI